jgi:hypothetical protein
MVEVCATFFDAQHCHAWSKTLFGFSPSLSLSLFLYVIHISMYLCVMSRGEEPRAAEESTSFQVPSFCMLKNLLPDDDHLQVRSS